MDTLAAVIVAAAAESKEKKETNDSIQPAEEEASQVKVPGESKTAAEMKVEAPINNEEVKESGDNESQGDDKDLENDEDDTKEGEEDSTMNDVEEEDSKAEETTLAAPDYSVSSGIKKVTTVKAKKSPAKRRKKCKKPPNYPKRPLSAYNIFFKDTREKIITEHGKTNFQEMVRLIASHWKEVSKEDKKKYEGMAAKDLMRYKEEVSAYEKDDAEKKRKEREMSETNRGAERKLQELQKNRKVEAASGVAASRLNGAHYEDDDDDTRTTAASILPHGSRFPYGAGREEAAIMAAMGGAGAGTGGMSSRDLEMARLRLEQDLRGVEEARALRLRQLELAHMQGGGSFFSSSGLRSSGMFGTGYHDNLELELQRRYLAGGSDPLARANENELRQRLSILRNPTEQAFEEQEKLLRESNFGASLTPAGLGGRFGAYSSALGMGMPSMGLGNQYEEILLREQMLRRERELLLGSGGTSSLYGGGLGAGGLASLGLRASTGLFGASSAAANADMHTSAAAAGLANLRGQMSYIPGSHLERLSDEELRALSAGRGTDSISKGTSAFKRVDGEFANREALGGEKTDG